MFKRDHVLKKYVHVMYSIEQSDKPNTSVDDEILMQLKIYINKSR